MFEKVVSVCVVGVRCLCVNVYGLVVVYLGLSCLVCFLIIVDGFCCLLINSCSLLLVVCCLLFAVCCCCLLLIVVCCCSLLFDWMRL